MDSILSPGPVRRRTPGALLSLLFATAVAAEPSLHLGHDLRDDRLCAAVELVNAFDPDVRGSIESGLPITVRITVELWRDRRSWFDKLVTSQGRRFRIRFDPGERLYLVRSTGRRTWEEAFENLDAALEEVSRQVLPIRAAGDLDRESTYFLAAEAAIQHLTLEEVRELDAWISGKVRGEAGQEEDPGPEEEGGGGITAAVFKFLVRRAGFGDRILRDRSDRFRSADLVASDPGPGAPAPP
jgi:hypothetical protein